MGRERRETRDVIEGLSSAWQQLSNHYNMLFWGGALFRASPGSVSEA